MIFIKTNSIHGVANRQAVLLKLLSKTHTLALMLVLHFLLKLFNKNIFTEVVLFMLCMAATFLHFKVGE